MCPQAGPLERLVGMLWNGVVSATRFGHLLLLTLTIGGAESAEPEPTDNRPPGDLNNYVFVANRTSPEIAAIDIDHDRVATRIEIAGIPYHYVVSEQMRKLAATHIEEQSVSIFDLRRMENSVLRLQITPEQLQIDPDGRMLAIGSNRQDAVALISLENNRVVHQIDGLIQPGDMIFDREGKRLFVASRSGSKIFVIDTVSAVIQEVITLRDHNEELPGIVDLTRMPGGDIGFALHGASGQISAIDLRSLEQLRNT